MGFADIQPTKSNIVLFNFNNTVFNNLSKGFFIIS